LDSRSFTFAFDANKQTGAIMLDRIAYSPDEAAHRASVGRTLIFAEIKSGRLTAYKAGARTLITDEALKAWIASLPTRAAAEVA
jgi:excisionase family DNA binding protein